MRANLKRHNRVYIRSSKNTYRPMRARVVAQLFYKEKYLRFLELSRETILIVYSRTSPQGPSWGQRILAVVERLQLWGDRDVKYDTR